MGRLEDMSRRRKASHTKLLKAESKVYKAFLEMKEAGASEREITETVEVGIEMAGGPGAVSARFALEVMEAVFTK